MSLPVNKLFRVLFTLGACAAALSLVVALWKAYVIAPWTRDGRVSADVVRIAPEVAGTVLEVAVEDNQRVKRGDVLYRIDPQRFKLAETQANAQLAAAEETLHQRQEEAKRRRGLDEIVPLEDIRRAGRSVAIAQADMQKAQAALHIAQLNLERSVLRAPADGFITHLRLRQGDYALVGQANIALIDATSFRVTGYFEETKLRRITVGAPASIRLMGSDKPLAGHVASIGRGISDDNGNLGDNGLPTVTPTFSWIRLAQPIPVRIALDDQPANVLLAAGMTASIDITPPDQENVAHGRLTDWLHAMM
ncbi:HlyD family secretion protein [Serratia bockelmannii]|nr:HlyD family secretion protein [Serratia bockelmannii]